MKSIKGTKTEQNLLKAFAGESQARNRYTFFAKIAKKEGYEQIAAIFLETARNEEVHAKEFFKRLEGGDLEITATYPAGVLSNTYDNLIHAATGEGEEWEELYPHFAEVAKEEGFDEISMLFTNIASIEQHHQERFQFMAEEVKNGTVFKSEEDELWQCRNCGFIHDGNEAPEICPACKHPQAYFEVI